MKVYCDREKHDLDEREWLVRSLAGTFFVVLAQSGLRVGELAQLRWGDLEWRSVHTKRYDGVQLLFINTPLLAARRRGRS